MQSKKPTLGLWFRGGNPWVWMSGAAVSLSVLAVIGLLLILAVNGLSHFWPKAIMQADYQLTDSAKSHVVIGSVADDTMVSAIQLRSAGIELPDDDPEYERFLIKMGNRDVTGTDFAWFLGKGFKNKQYPEDLIVMQRREWGNFYGRLNAVKESGNTVGDANSATEAELWQMFQQRLQRANDIHEEIEYIEKKEIGEINYGMERLRLRSRRLELNKVTGGELAQAQAEIAEERAVLDAQYAEIQKHLQELYNKVKRDSIIAETANGASKEIPLAHIVDAIKPNSMSVFEKVVYYFGQMRDFLLDDPREANTEGGIYPAIFGTVMMVILMSILVTPMGVVAAVYLREYAKQGVVTQVIRIAVNNLAGVPSIVYGVFGLGFFIYFIGHHMDQALFAESLPSPTFGTPGLLWASITLALLTLPVVIVATEEGLARIPRSVKEGSLALGATKFETLTKVVLPMASPAMMTGLILAVARAAGEVAPLMLVGVVKLAPSLPLDGNYPYLHLDQKFMHLGFHIYDVGFQSPNVEAARPLVYATALLLVIVIALLNFAAVSIRNRLREKYKALEH